MAKFVVEFRTVVVVKFWYCPREIEIVATLSLQIVPAFIDR